MTKAGFLKRMFAFVVDFTVVILATVLIYLFPFSLIINKSIDTDYKTNVGDVVNSVNTKYSGSSSIFGTSTDGLLTVLQKYYSGDTECTQTIVDSYYLSHTNTLNDTNLIINSLVDNQNDIYDESESEENRFYSQVYSVYGYLLYSYNCLCSFKTNDSFEVYEDIKTRDDLTSEQVTTFETAYTNQLNEDFGKALNALIKALISYSEANENLDTSSLTSYRIIHRQALAFLGDNIATTGGLTEDDVDDIRYFVDRFEAFFGHSYGVALDGTKLSKKAYYSFYYNLLIEQFNELVPVHEKYSTHSTYVVIYALVGFTFIYTLYSLLFRGKTLGRRAVKINIVHKNENVEINVIQIFMHDILFGFGYLILIGCFDVRIMLGAGLLFVIADAIMVRVTKSSRTIRNFLSQTRVVEE